MNNMYRPLQSPIDEGISLSLSAPCSTYILSHASLLLFLKTIIVNEKNWKFFLEDVLQLLFYTENSDYHHTVLNFVCGTHHGLWRRSRRKKYGCSDKLFSRFLFLSFVSDRISPLRWRVLRLLEFIPATWACLAPRQLSAEDMSELPLVALLEYFILCWRKVELQL